VVRNTSGMPNLVVRNTSGMPNLVVMNIGKYHAYPWLVSLHPQETDPQDR
jgi:hypothetical protein